jgi:hypothetical protein
MLPFAALMLTFAFTGKGEALTEFSMDGDKFKVLLPASPQKSTVKLPGAIEMHRYVAKANNGGVYIVTTTDVPDAAKDSEDKLQSRLNSARDQAVQSVNGKLLKETAKTLGGKYPGREIDVEMASKDRVRNRFYFVDGRLYQLLAVGGEPFVTSGESARFFDSLVVAK